jgi:hypothetical protein
MMEKIEESLEGPGAELQVMRVIVLDAASNGVSTLRAFAKQDKYHYITALDDNQWNPRRLIKQGSPQRYRHGNATLRECLFELEDSKEKGYLVEVRAIWVEWDHGKRTVLITSLPADSAGASVVVKSYFDRWPYQESQFRSMKSFACLNRMNGYGKQRIPDENMLAKQKKLQLGISKLERKLRGPLQRIDDVGEQISQAVGEERRIKARGEVVNGERQLPHAARQRLKELNAIILANQRQIKAIEAEAGRPLKRLKKYEKELSRVRDKGEVYRVDVELDQIMGFFRIALVNIAAWFLSNCLKGRMSLAHLFNSVLMLPAQIELTNESRRVILKRNPKDPVMMKKLESALRYMTDLAIRDLENRKIEFQLSADLS